MGVHHSELPEKGGIIVGEADIINNPARVVGLPDGEWGLYVDTVLPKDKFTTEAVTESFNTGELNSFSC